MKLLKLLRSLKSLLQTVAIVNDFTVGTNHPSINYLVRAGRTDLCEEEVYRMAQTFSLDLKN